MRQLFVLGASHRGSGEQDDSHCVGYDDAWRGVAKRKAPKTAYVVGVVLMRFCRDEVIWLDRAI